MDRVQTEFTAIMRSRGAAPPCALWLAWGVGSSRD